MRIACLAERRDGERRVALTPESAGKLAKLGAEVAVEAGAGTGASIPDTAYAEAGAAVGSAAETAAGAGIVLAIEAPDPALLSNADEGAKVLALFDPHDATGRLRAYAEAGLEALAMELLPRITRAQSMDVLSSQSNLAGYVAVLAAANEYGRAFPMMMTAAGTVSPARVFVMGVGVAGLQAIATAKRLGAQVSATDVRSATREQVESLGAKPVFVDDVAGIEGEGSGGYAGEMSAEYRAAQADLVSAHLAKQDIVITTALIPGKPAPRLVSDAQLATMRPGQRRLRSRGRARGQCRRRTGGRGGPPSWRDRNGGCEPGEPRSGRCQRAVRAQPVEFRDRVLGWGGGAARDRRRDRRCDPAHSRRADRASRFRCRAGTCPGTLTRR